MEFKKCTNSKCGKRKAVTEFYNLTSSRDGFSYRCKSCIDEANAIYQRENKDKVNLAARESAKKRRAANPQKYRKLDNERRRKNPKSSTARVLRWQKRNRGKVAAKSAREKAYPAVPIWSEHDEIIELYEKSSDMREAGVMVHVDHIVPLRHPKVCGLHCFANLRILDGKKNCAKGNKLLDIED